MLGTPSQSMRGRMMPFFMGKKNLAIFIFDACPMGFESVVQKWRNQPDWFGEIIAAAWAGSY